MCRCRRARRFDQLAETTGRRRPVPSIYDVQYNAESLDFRQSAQRYARDWGLDHPAPGSGAEKVIGCRLWRGSQDGSMIDRAGWACQMTPLGEPKIGDSACDPP